MAERAALLWVHHSHHRAPQLMSCVLQRRAVQCSLPSLSLPSTVAVYCTWSLRWKHTPLLLTVPPVNPYSIPPAPTSAACPRCAQRG